VTKRDRLRNVVVRSELGKSNIVEETEITGRNGRNTYLGWLLRDIHRKHFLERLAKRLVATKQKVERSISSSEKIFQSQSVFGN
jgi:hypothetical protein